jgi:hypothetical protein
LATNPAPLPLPDSDELRALVPTRMHQAIYAVLYQRRTDPPTMQEVQAAVGAELGGEAANQVHLSKRLRELRDTFVIPLVRQGGRHTYQLERLKSESERKPDAKISMRLRAKVLRHQQCEMCGRTPRDDGVRLHVDHKIPREWGGPSEEWNLQALCSDCNEGKKAYYATFGGASAEIMKAIKYDSVHVRIGELLKAFNALGRRTPDEILELVAESRGPQRYWEKRMRELRQLGWEFKPHLKTVDGIRRTDWELIRWEPWPEGTVAASIRRQGG